MEKTLSPNIEARFRAYAEKLSTALGYADRGAPFQVYCTGLLLPVERKSVEPMAARLAPATLVPNTNPCITLWPRPAASDDTVMRAVRDYVAPEMQRQGPILAWIVDDTGFPKKGNIPSAWPGSIADNWGNRTIASVPCPSPWATLDASLPVAYRLDVPQEWVADRDRRTRREFRRRLPSRPNPRSPWINSGP